MITVFGEGRGFRVVWLLEEMGLAYRLRPVDPLAGVENDPEFLAVNPAGFIPAIQDGEVTMVESIAIMEYLMARCHGNMSGHEGMGCQGTRSVTALGTARATGASQPNRPLLAGSDQLIGYAQAGFRIASNAARARNPDRVSPCLRA